MESESDCGDLFDAVEGLYEESRDQGHAEGLELGIRHSFVQGEELGVAYGQKIGEELGYYIGCLMVWQRLIHASERTQRLSFEQALDAAALSALNRTKLTKELACFVATIEVFPFDPKVEELTDMLDLLRGKFKLIQVMVGRFAKSLPRFHFPLSSSSASSSTQFADDELPIGTSHKLPLRPTGDLSF